MAPSRGKGKARAIPASTGRASAARRSTRASRKSENGAGHVFDDLLAEASKAESAEDLSDRPLKKRKVATKATQDQTPAFGRKVDVPRSTTNRPQLQTVEDSSASEDDSDESEFDFEDVDLEQASGPAGDVDADDNDIADVSVAINSTKTPQHTRTKRKPASAAEKAFRLLVHKAHVLCLLGHCLHINSWCNNEIVHRHLRPLLSERIVSFLNPKAGDSQFRQNEAFMDGIQQAADVFRGEFKINASGMRSAQWTNEADDIAAAPMDRADFIVAARNLEGSQDTGNQLFCALLRAVGVEARMVCSLQPLPFVNIAPKSSTPQKTAKPTVFATLYDNHSPASGSNPSDPAITTSSTIGSVPSARRRLGQPAFSSDPTPSTASPKTKKPLGKPHYPIFWTEAFDPAHQKWIVVDPLVTQIVNKPSKLEPPASYALNQLSYVIAFESDAVTKDVTRRYARAFNAKTRRSRVESTENGVAWMKKVLRFFRRTGGALDRDGIEDAELSQREVREGMPANVLDFKSHPVYALERHMKRHETIFPKREVGKVNAGTAAKPRMEAVFRRQDVCICRSGDKWYRLGRVVKEGEVGIKRVPARRIKRNRSPDQEGEEGEDEGMTPLYAEFQTDLYVPPPVTAGGRVPRNAFGNLDIYVPSMVPAGGTHIRHPLARPAALALRIDVVDAVVGFSFKGRQGTAVVDGVVIAEIHADAVRAAIEGLEGDKEEEESRTRSKVALGLWRKFIVGLRIRERVAVYGDNTEKEDTDEEMDVDRVEGGGFVETDTADEDTERLPTAGKFFLAELMAPRKGAGRAKADVRKEESEEEAEFEGDDTDEEITNAQPSTSRRTTRRRIVQDEDSEDEYMPDHEAVGTTGDHFGEDGGGGGYLPDEDDDDDEMGNGHGHDGEGGGFVADDEGGGFVREDGFDDDGGGGGGFVADDDEDMQGGVGTDGGGGGFIVEHGENEMPESQQANGEAKADAIHTPPTTDNHETEITSTADVSMANGADGEVSEDADDTPRASHTVGAEVAAAESSVDESDRGSMLSHDPEDEDAEPDWLESD